MRTIADWLAEKELSIDSLIEESGLDRKVVQAIVRGQYTPSPVQRTTIARVLRVGVDQIAWGHTVPVQHLRGHGPQFGRTP